MPGAVRPLPRGQRIPQSLGPLVPDAVVCSNIIIIIRAPPSGPSPDSSSLLKGDKQGRQQQQGEGRGSASM